MPVVANAANGHAVRIRCVWAALSVSSARNKRVTRPTHQPLSQLHMRPSAARTGFAPIRRREQPLPGTKRRKLRGPATTSCSTSELRWRTGRLAQSDSSSTRQCNT
ncbi:hypothetical protein ANCDUO_02917 [Ancylostoma duodenale]|uniref:Uncharacterized protein n=1 Tax=Ancylostoma duodenale TaxID=51022 RepID=A0A0C2DV74_9BILA|nr:hypothetical protein ANCDUO_02917 [Ancylostoma duodenale]